MGLTNLFSDIADAIRTKTGSQATIVANNFPTAIASIPTYNEMKLTSSTTSLAGAFKYPTVTLGSKIEEAPSIDTTGVTDMSEMFSTCSHLTTAPLYDTSSVTNMLRMFYNCQSLTTVPIYNTSNVTDMSGMFNGCSSLTDDSLDNILVMCANATGVSTKELSDLGIFVSYYPDTNFEDLPNYSTFINAGWTLGADT